MKGLETNVKKIRMKIFEEIASFSFKNEQNFNLEEIVEKIYIKIEKEKFNFKGSFELKKEVLKEMIRLGMGISLISALKQNVSFKEIVKEKYYYELPLVNVISSACNGCSENCFLVTNACKGCLARPCQEVCLKGAIFFNEENKSQILEEKCVKCGRCAAVCPYSAIIEKKRPCAKACALDAIKINAENKAQIDSKKCVSCGACIVSCPFGAVFYKSQIFQLIWSIKNKENVVACVAPAFVGQFGQNVSFEKVKAALKEVGFVDVVEVAVGADMCSYGEAKEFVEKVPQKQPFMATSCCPAWSVMAKKNFKDVAPYVSMELTPMVFTARLIKSKNKDFKVAFIGPCAAKKLEAFRKSVRSDVDFVLTFEETMGIFKAKKINFDYLTFEEDEKASGDGRNFAVTNGVAQAVLECVKKIDPNKEIFVESAQGLSDCKKLLLLAKAGKKNGFLLEGMACKGGCVGGPGTTQPVAKATKLVNEFSNKAKKRHAFESEFINSIEDLTHEHETQKN